MKCVEAGAPSRAISRVNQKARLRTPGHSQSAVSLISCHRFWSRWLRRPEPTPYADKSIGWRARDTEDECPVDLFWKHFFCDALVFPPVTFFPFGYLITHKKIQLDRSTLTRASTRAKSRKNSQYDATRGLVWYYRSGPTDGSNNVKLS